MNRWVASSGAEQTNRENVQTFLVTCLTTCISHASGKFLTGRFGGSFLRWRLWCCPCEARYRAGFNDDVRLVLCLNTPRKRERSWCVLSMRRDRVSNRPRMSVFLIILYIRVIQLKSRNINDGTSRVPGHSEQSDKTWANHK